MKRGGFGLGFSLKKEKEKEKEIVEIRGKRETEKSENFYGSKGRVW